MQLMAKHVDQSLKQVSEVERGEWELHVVAHSAGSILLAHALRHLCALGIQFRTLQFFAPAIRIDEFEQYALPFIKRGACPKATLYLLGDQQELDDTVGPYGRSLLWLVSNAFEDDRGTPILGMKEYLDRKPALARSAFREIIVSTPKGKADSPCTSQTHGGFDNDPAAMNSVLARILGKAPSPAFNERDLSY
jgi:hypothetical protein